MGKEIITLKVKRRRVRKRTALEELVSAVRRKALTEAAEAVCEGCARGWPLREDGETHVPFGETLVFECRAAPIFRLKP